MKTEYEYAVVRYVPCVEREEFVNVGVLLYCRKQRFAGMLWAIDEGRVSSLSQESELDLLRSHLEVMQYVCEGDERGGALAKLDMTERFRWLTANRSTIIQCSAVHTGICESAEDTLKLLFARLVE